MSEKYEIICKLLARSYTSERREVSGAKIMDMAKVAEEVLKDIPCDRLEECFSIAFHKNERVPTDRQILKAWHEVRGMESEMAFRDMENEIPLERDDRFWDALERNPHVKHLFENVDIDGVPDKEWLKEWYQLSQVWDA